MRRSINRSALICLLSVVLALGAFGEVQPTRAATALLPDLKMVPLTDIRITTENGRRLLRFQTIFENVGRGQFELLARRASTSQTTMGVSQRIYDDAGGSTYRVTKGLSRYAGDGHDHWHVQGVVTYELWLESSPGGIRRGAKTGFCFFDTTPRNTSLPGSPPGGYYRQAWCGTQSSLESRTGVSVGWGDRYPSNFVFQWVDITGLPAGTYMLRATVDQQNWYTETDDRNNCVYVRLTIPASGAHTQLAKGDACGPASVTPVSQFPGGVTWNPPRRLNFQAGTYVGYKFNSMGTVLDTKSATLPRASGASASARAIPNGKTSNWFYVVNGIWAGYWIRDTAAVSVSP